MMRPLSSCSPLGISFIALSMLAVSCTPAAATAIVSVRAFWDARLFGPSAQLTLSCFGGAAAAGAGCTDTESVSAQNIFATLQSYDVTSASGVLVTNNSDTTFVGFGSNVSLRVNFSAFNSGGPQIGASVTDP